MKLKRKKIKKIKVIYRKLAREGVQGWAYTDKGKIEVEQRLFGRKLLSTLIHESAHLGAPSLSENMILKLEKIITQVLWQENFRKVEQ